MTRRRWWAVAGAAGVLMLAAAAVLAHVLLRDPEPRFAERRSRLVRAETGNIEGAPGHVVQDVRLTAASGLVVDITVKRPDEADAPGRKRPLILLLGGHRTGRDAVDLISDTRGTIVAAVSYPFDGNPRVKGLAVLPEVPAIRRALLDTPPALMLALDHLLARPDVDASTVEMVGVSLGAPFGCIAGALDTRITRVWSVHGAGDPRELLDHNLRRRIPFGPARGFVATAAYLLIDGPHLAPEQWVSRISPRPFVMINAEEDERLPRATVERLYAHALAPREIVWMPGQHVLPRRAELVQRLIDAVLARVPGAELPDETAPALLPRGTAAAATGRAATARRRSAALYFDAAGLENRLERLDAVIGGFQEEVLHHRLGLL